MAEARLKLGIDGVQAVVGGLKQVGDKVRDVSGSLSGLTAIGGSLSIGAFAAMIKSSIDAADHLNDLSKSTSITVANLAGLKLLAEQSGSDLDGMAKAINKLSVNMAKDSERFAKLGVTAKDPIEAFKQLSDIFSAIQDPQLRAALGAEALGKQWESAAPALAEGGARIGEMIDKGKRLSGVTQEMADNSDKFNDQLAEMKVLSGSLGTKLANEMLPAMIDITGAVKTAYEESGKLTAMWVALGGLGAFLFTDEFASAETKIKKLNKELKSLEEDRASLSPMGYVGQWLTGTSGELDAKIAATQEKIKALQEQIAQPAQDAAAKKAAAEKKAADDKAAKEAEAKTRAFVIANEEKTKSQDSFIKSLIKERDTLMMGEERAKLHQAAIIGITGAKLQHVKALLTEITAYKEAVKIADVRATQRRAEQEAIDAYFQEQTAGYNAAVKGSQDALKAAQDEYAQFGMSKSQIEEITLRKLESTRASFLEGSAGYEAAQKQIDAQRELIGVLRKTEAANEWKSIFDSIDSTAHDTFVSIFDSGKSAFDRLRDTLKNGLLDLLYQMTIKKWIFSIGASVSGMPGIASAAGSSVLSNSTGGMLGSLVGGITGIGTSIAGFGSGVASGLGMGGMDAMAAYAANIGNLSTAASAGSTIGSAIAAIPGWGWALAAAAVVATILDDSGTIHTGGAAQASASGTSVIDARSLGFMRIDSSAESEKMVSGLASSIVGILDNTATAFGKTAGYTAATAFADDTSKDGAWGALLIEKMGTALVDWDSDRQSRWAPREFADGDAGRAQYLAALSASVRTALDSIGLPAWAQNMLNALGDAPAIADLSNVVDKINTTQRALVVMGDTLAGFADLSDATVSALMSAFGGIDALAGAASAYYEKFYTEEEKVANTTRQVADALSAVGLKMPTTRDEFRALVEAQIKLGESGTKAVATLFGVAGAFGTVADAAEESAQKAIADAAKARDDLTSVYERESSALRSTLDRMKDFSRSLLTGSLSPLTNKQKYEEAYRQFNDVVARKNAGDQNAINNFEDVASELLEISRIYNASGSGYQSDFAMVAAETQKTANAAQSQLSLMDRQVSGLASINGSIVSGNAALQASINDLARAMGVKNMPNGGSDFISSLYAGYAGRSTPDAAGAAYWQAVLQKNGVDYTVKAFQDSVDFVKLNGSHANGLDYVPFDGYRAELHRGEAVLTSAQAMDWRKYGNQDNSALVAEIKRLNEKLERLEKAVDRNGDKMAGATVVAAERSSTKIAEAVSEGGSKAAYAQRLAGEARLV